MGPIYFKFTVRVVKEKQKLKVYLNFSKKVFKVKLDNNSQNQNQIQNQIQIQIQIESKVSFFLALRDLRLKRSASKLNLQ